MPASGAEHHDAQPIITIRGDRVGLGPLREDILDTLHLRWGNDLAAGLMQGGLGFATTAHSRRFFEHRTGDNNHEEFLVYELATTRPIGSAGLHHVEIEERSAEISYNILEHDCRGKGYGTEATVLTLDYAFTAKGLHRVHARVFEYNEPSIRVARKVGFREYGRAREAHWASGRYWDVLLFDILHHEFTSPVLAREFSFLKLEDRG